MPYTGTIYRVLIASPSDCAKERELVPRVIDAWNSSHSFHVKAILEPVMWETHARPSLDGRPQAVINKQLVETCDILIGTFWTRLGTDSGKVPSGTAEEIEEFRGKAKPVLLYFSSVPAVPDSINPEQYKALIEYKKSLSTAGLFFAYDDIDQLRDLLQRHLASIMAEIHKGVSEDSATTEEAKENDGLQQLTEMAGALLREMNLEWTSERDSDPMDTQDGKRMWSRAAGHLVQMRSMIVSGHDEIAALVDNLVMRAKKLQRHEYYADGGKSFAEFWAIGDDILEDLKHLPALLKDTFDDRSREASN